MEQDGFISDEQLNSADMLVREGNLAIDDKKWKEAVTFFNQALEHNPTDAQAYMGKFLCQMKQQSFERFMQVLLSQTENVEEVPIDVMAMYKKPIQKIVKQYSIPDLLTEEMIMERFVFELSFVTTVPGREKQFEEYNQALNHNPNFARVLRYAQGDYKDYVETLYDNLTNVFQKRIEDAKKEEEELLETQVKQYCNLEFKKIAKRVIREYNALLLQQDLYEKKKNQRKQIIAYSLVGIAILILLCVGIYLFFGM